LPIKSKIVFLFIYLALSNIIFSQNGGMKITGFVFDSETQIGIVGANIIITQEKDNQFQTGAASGLDGNFVTSRLPIGKYKVVFRNLCQVASGLYIAIINVPDLGQKILKFSIIQAQKQVHY
jgi:hypothetical protein